MKIPQNTKFIFVDEMKLLLLMNPAFNPKGESVGEENDLYKKRKRREICLLIMLK